MKELIAWVKKTGCSITIYSKPQLSTVPQEKGVKLYVQKILLKIN